MITEEKIAWLRLLRTPKIGRITFFHLLNFFHSAIAAIEGMDEYIAKLGKKSSYKIVSRDSVMKFLEECNKHSVKLVFSSDAEYPQEFLLASDFAPVLFCKGNLALLNKNSLAVVGSRAASLQGISFTKKLVRDLFEIVIVSGFAKGIDFAAHEVSLSSGTIAVLGCGVNVIYPDENRDLYSKILYNNGLIISEIGVNDSPKPNFFAYRNRVIAGIAKGVLVVEAAMGSGSLITAKYAVEQGKNVFAVPGHPYDIRSAGTNYLLKNGAIFVRSAEDILSEFYDYTPLAVSSSLFEVQEENLEEVKTFLLSNLSSSYISIAEIVSCSKYSTAIINAAVAELELLDKVHIDQDLIRLL